MKCIYKDTFRNIDYYYQEIDYQYLYTILMFKLVEKYEEKIVKVDKIYVKLFFNRWVNNFPHEYFILISHYKT